MRVVAAFVMSLVACTAAQGQGAAVCETHPWLRSFDDAALEIRYCALQRLHRTALRKVITERSSEAEAENHRCLRAYAEIALELSGQRKRIIRTLRCDEKLRVEEGR